MNKVGKTLEPNFWLERIMETMNIRNVEKGIVDLPPAPPVTIGPDGKPMMLPAPAMSSPGPLPPMSEQSGEMPMDGMEAGLAQRT
jgi:hypothetical protein